MSNKPFLGAYMIVKNEESCLAEALKSLKGIDEITILDTGSTDNTAGVAEKFDCNFIAGEYEWEDHFAKARNKCLEYTEAEWLIVLDADEVFEGDINKLRKVLKDADYDAYNVKTISSKHNSEHNSIRIHRNDEIIHWEGAAHNYLKVACVGFLEDFKVFYGYSEAHKEDPDRTLRILRKHCAENPEAVRERYYLGREYYYKKEYRKTMHHLALYRKRAYFAAELADAHILCARCCIALKEINEAWGHCFRALQINADLKEVYRILSSLAGPNNSKTWKRMEKIATNKNALFAR